MATRLYLRTLAPTNDPGGSERSSVLPVGHFQDYFGTVQSLRLVAGASETSEGGSSLAHTDHDDEFFGTFSSEALDAQTINANTWTIALMLAEGNPGANSFIALSLYLFREPSTVVGYIYDSDTPLGNEWSNNPVGRVSTFSGSSVTAQLGDYLVLEVWRHTSGQAMSTSWTQTLYYNGATDVVEDATGGDAASYLETPQNLVFAGAAAGRRRVGIGSGRALTF